MNKIKKSIFYILSIGLIIFFASATIIDERLLIPQLSQNACENVLFSIATKPSSIELNNITNHEQKLGLNSSKVWIHENVESKKLIKSLLQLVEDDYKNNKTMAKRLIAIDYSSDESFIGTSRNKFICEYMQDIFGSNKLESFSYKNKDYDADDFYLGKKIPKTLDSLLKIKKGTFKDRIYFIFNYLFSLTK